MAFAAFIGLGLSDGLPGTAWPAMRRSFGLLIDAMGIILFSSTAGYLLSSFFNRAVVIRLGIGKLLVFSCAATGSAMPGCAVSDYWLLLPFMGFLSGIGGGAIDSGLNRYAAVHHGEMLMLWLHASFEIGVIMGPIIMTGGRNVFSSWRFGYLVVGRNSGRHYQPGNHSSVSGAAYCCSISAAQNFRKFRTS